MVNKVLSLAQLYIDVLGLLQMLLAGHDLLERKKNKSFIEKLNRIGPVMESWGTAGIII